jgi:D-glycero-D-manno-heptose 1,7-bisphosphate phosphatase
MNPRKGLFLDRDGVINIDRGYVYRPEDFEFVEGIFHLCRAARQLGWPVFVVTNQAGIARGIYTEGDFLRLSAWMCGVFKSEGAPIEKVYFCPYHPEAGIGRYKVDSPMRKPWPGMFLQAAEEFGVDLSDSVSVGDKEIDVQAGIAAGIRCNLLYRAEAAARPVNSVADAVVARLVDVVPYLQRSTHSATL